MKIYRLAKKVSQFGASVGVCVRVGGGTPKLNSYRGVSRGLLEPFPYLR